MFYANVLMYAILPIFLIYAMWMILKTDKPKRLWLLFLTMTPFKPSPGLTYLFPGVETPPDPAHSEPVPTEVDQRPPKDPPPGTQRKS